MNAPPFDYVSARAFLEAREARRQAALDLRFADAWRDFRAIVEMIRLRYQPRAIYQWGSLLDRTQFSEISDIDIAVVEGWDPGRFLEVLDAAAVMTRFPLDIVRLERIHPAHARGIRRRGRLVYGQD